jgi:hypothetical protein
MDRHNGALEEVCAKAGNLTKVLKDHRNILNITFDGSDEDGRVIRIERGAQNSPMAPKLVKKDHTCCLLQNLSNWVNRKHEKKQG